MADWLQTPVYGPLFGAVVCLVMWVIFCVIVGLMVRAEWRAGARARHEAWEEDETNAPVRSAGLALSSQPQPRVVVREESRDE